MISDVLLLSFGIITGIIPAIVWGKMGGDESFEKDHPKLRMFLHAFHHWMLGIVVMIIGAFTNPFILGWGLGAAMDDLFFHSFEKYFKREGAAV